MKFTVQHDMGHLFHQYIYQDVYVPVWPNIAASAIAAFWVVARMKIHLRTHRSEIARLLGGIEHRSASRTSSDSRTRSIRSEISASDNEGDA